MGLDDSKLDPRPVIQGHWASLVHGDSSPSVRDLIEQYAVPGAIGLAAYFIGIEVGEGLGAALLTISGIFAAFMFQLTIQLLDRAAAWAETHPVPGPSTSKHAILLEELSANAGYAALICVLAAAMTVVCIIAKPGLGERVAAAVLMMLLAHLATTLLLVGRRVFLLTRARLLDTRTGSSAFH